MRPSKEQWAMQLAELTATRATCARRKVGCVLTNHFGHVIATGYNGPPRGFPHCEGDHQCEGASAPSGTGLELCQAVHAEQNALLQCRDVDTISICFCTTAPCVTCVKLLLNTSCRKIIYKEDYPHAEEARRLWLQGGREWEQIDMKDELSDEDVGRAVTRLIKDHDFTYHMIGQTVRAIGRGRR